MDKEGATLTWWKLGLHKWSFSGAWGASISRWSWHAAAAKLLQLCPTLCDPIDGSPSGSPVPGILQARTLEWVAISFSNAGKWKVKVKSLSRVRLLATPRTAAYQAPPFMGFSRQEYWSGVPLPSLGDMLHWGNHLREPFITQCPPQYQEKTPRNKLLLSKTDHWNRISFIIININWY